MFERTEVFRSRRLVLIVALALTALASLLIGGRLAMSKAQGDILAAGCGDGYVCFWAITNYEGQEAHFDGNWCCNRHTFDQFHWSSAKNRLNNRSIKLYFNNGGTFTQKACMDPNENRPDPGAFNAFQMQSNSCGS